MKLKCLAAFTGPYPPQVIFTPCNIKAFFGEKVQVVRKEVIVKFQYGNYALTSRTS